MAFSRFTTARSNLESFLQSITPVVPSQLLPQNCIHGINSLWQPLNKDWVEYFTLQDLWECYDEWSAYGVGTPIALDGALNIMQYYVPYLSAIQIYTSRTFVGTRNIREDDSTISFESDSCSDDESYKLLRSLSNNSTKTWDGNSEDLNLEQDSFSPMASKLGDMHFQYFEFASPYWRIPLMDKIIHLSRSYPGLMTLKSVDLSPASWMAIAWYPIYHIPNQRNIKELSTCFLTYHTLSSTFQDNGVEDDEDENGNGNSCWEIMRRVAETKCGEGNNGIPLPPFGLATYKIQGNIWTLDHDRMSYLQSAADSWLKQLNVHHHDFSFFTTRTTL